MINLLIKTQLRDQYCDLFMLHQTHEKNIRGNKIQLVRPPDAPSNVN